MSEISDYARRINEALERIDQVAARVARAQADAQADQGDGTSDGSGDGKGDGETRARLDAQSREIARLKAANAELMEANRALREAAEAGGADGDLLSRSMTAELEALRAERRAETAEMKEILEALDPLIAEDRHA